MHAVSSGFLRLMRSAVRIAAIESGFSVGTLPAFFIVASIALFTPSLHAQLKASLRGTPVGEPGILGQGGLLSNSVGWVSPA